MQVHFAITLPVLLTLAGGLVLLASWIVQTFLYDLWDQRSASLDRAETIYVTLLSNTLMLNAMKNAESQRRMIFQLALDYIIRGLPDDDQKRWQRKLAGADEEKLNDFSLRLMQEVTRQQKTIERWRGIGRSSFVATYLIGSLIVAAGQVLQG